MRILQLDKNHPLITEQLSAKGFLLDEDTTSTYQEVLNKIADYHGIIIRSRIPIDQSFIEHAKNLKFIARVGAGMENIDVGFAEKSGIKLISSPEGNRDSVAEHVVGMLLILMHRLFIASSEVKNSIWKREENRGDELLGKTFCRPGKKLLLEPIFHQQTRDLRNSSLSRKTFRLSMPKSR